MSFSPLGKAAGTLLPLSVLGGDDGMGAAHGRALMNTRTWSSIPRLRRHPNLSRPSEVMAIGLAFEACRPVGECPSDRMQRWILVPALCQPVRRHELVRLFARHPASRLRAWVGWPGSSPDGSFSG